MNFEAMISKLANDIITAETNYVWDPEHKKNPGSGYQKTDKGWSKSDGKGEITKTQQKKVPSAPVKPTSTPDVSGHPDILKSKSGKQIPNNKDILDVIYNNYNDFSEAEKNNLLSFYRQKADALSAEAKKHYSHPEVFKNLIGLNNETLDIIELLKSKEGYDQKGKDIELTNRVIAAKNSKDFKMALGKVSSAFPDYTTEEATVNFLSNPKMAKNLKTEERKALQEYFEANKSAFENELSKEHKNLLKDGKGDKKTIGYLSDGIKEFDKVLSRLSPLYPSYQKLTDMKKSGPFQKVYQFVKNVKPGPVAEQEFIDVLGEPTHLNTLTSEEKKAISDFFQMKKQLWAADAKKNPDLQTLAEDGIKKMDQIISLVNPNTNKKAPDPSQVMSRLFKEPEMISVADKPKVIQTYKNWLAANKDKKDKDTQAKVSDVRLAVKMLEGPRFKKVDPKLSGNLMYLVKDNDLGDELQELAGFKETIKNHPQMSNKEYKQRIDQGMKLPRSQAQLKQAFIMNMNPMNYPDMQAFQAAKQRVQKMDINDFGKLLASLNADEEETI